MTQIDSKAEIPRRLEATPGLTSIPKYRRPLAHERRIAKPIQENDSLDVPATALFVDVLPIVNSIDGVSIGISTSVKKTETVFIDVPRPNTDASTVPIMARISAEGQFPHRRSVNYLDSEDATKPLIIVIGGKEYSGVSAKGADLQGSRIVADRNFDSGVHFIGLVTSDLTERMVTVSNWLRKNGITAETIWSVSRLDMLPVLDYKKQPEPGEPFIKSRLLTPAEFKRRLIEQIKPEQEIDIDKVREYLQGVDFVVINRATTVPFRLSDLRIPFEAAKDYSSKDHPYLDFNFMMNYMFSYLNRGRNAESQFNMLEDPKDSKDKMVLARNRGQVDRFFEYFGHNLGSQIGLLHKKGVVHGYLHPGNITADGSFCDLDSLTGEPLGLGDNPATKTQILKDVADVMRGIYRFTSVLVKHGVLSQEVFDRLGQTFLDEYIHTRSGDFSDSEQQRQIQYLLMDIVSREIIEAEPDGGIKNVKRRWEFNDYIKWLKKQTREEKIVT
jgi:hypothetical protein